MITRRKIIIALGAGAFAPAVSFAQEQGKVWRVGFLAYRHMEFVDADNFYGRFTQGMRELGYVAGKNLVIEWRSAEGETRHLAELAEELVRLKVDVLVTAGTATALAAQKATATIPLVCVLAGDPVGLGLVKTLARPGGNITGLTSINTELGSKLLDMLRTTVPKATRVAVLVNPANASSAVALKKIQAAAQRLGVRIQPVAASSLQQITDGFAAMARQNAEALIVPQEALFSQHLNKVAELAVTQRLPSICGYSRYAKAGGLMSYGQNGSDNYRRAATFVDKILKGANAGDIPIEQATRFELTVNARTAAVLGIEIPPSILVQASEIIE
ncbi:MAG: ABC transporter substrate-binding protein [Woeseiaceae bacterium]|nr:ABC transporter substrate-binding protein [Woeseiaceae bacterium]